MKYKITCWTTPAKQLSLRARLQRGEQAEHEAEAVARERVRGARLAQQAAQVGHTSQVGAAQQRRAGALPLARAAELPRALQRRAVLRRRRLGALRARVTGSVLAR